MIPSLLAQSQGITPKPKAKARFTFTSPKTGKTYEWTKPNDPTEDDVKSLIAIDNQLAGDLDFAKKVSGNVDAAKARTPKKPTPTGAEVFGRGLRGMAKDIEGALGPIQSTARDAVLLGPVPFIANALAGKKAPSIKDVLPKEAAPILDVLVPSSIVTDPIDVAGQFLVDPKQAAYDQFGKAFDPKAPTLDRILTGLNIAGLIPGAYGAVKGVQKVAKGLSKGAKAVGVVDDAAEVAAKSLLTEVAPTSDVSPVSDLGGVVVGKSKPYTPKGDRVDVEFRIVERDSIQASHNGTGFAPNPKYLSDLQNRDRGTLAERKKVDNQAKNLDPARLQDDFNATDRGAPVVGLDGMVESGNGRVMSIDRAKARYPERYNAYVTELTTRYPQAASFKNPVLVQVRLGDVSDVAKRRQFAKSSNEGSSSAFSLAEQARADIDNLPKDIEARFDRAGKTLDSSLASRSNDGIVGEWMRSLSDEDLPGLVDSGGQLSEAGRARFGRSIISYVLGEESAPILTRMQTDADFSKRVSGGLEQAVPGLLDLRRAEREGSEIAKDLRLVLVNALQYVDEAKNSRGKTSEWFEQGAFESRDPNALKVAKLLTMAKSKDSVARFITTLTDAAKEADGGMFADELAFKNVTEAIDSAFGNQALAADLTDAGFKIDAPVISDPVPNLSPEELAAQKIVPTRGTPTTVADVETPATNLNEIKTGFELTLKAPKGTFSYKVVGKAPRIKDGSKSWLTEVTGPQGTSQRYESETSLRAKQKTIEESVRVSDSFKWLNEAGDVAKTEKSTQSNSTYATVNTPSGKTVKVRSSDHLQPADDQALRSGLSKARVITLPKGTKVRVYEGGDGSLGLDFYNGVTDEGRMFAIGAARKFDESGLIDDVITIADNPTTPATVTVLDVPAVAPVSAPKPTPEAPTPAPSATPGRFAASNAASNDIRADLGIDKLPEPTRRTWDAVLEDAKKSYNADVIDARIADTKNPLNDTETAQAAMRSAELRNALRTATGDAYDGIEKKLIDHTIALREAGTEQGRALAARNMAILNDYSLDGMYRRFAGASKAKKADDIPKETRDEIKRLTDEREAVTVERDRLKAELDAKRAELATKAVSGEVSAVRSRRVKPGDVARKKELITKILDRQKEYVSSVPGQFLFDAAPEIKELARIKIAEGMDKLDDIRAAVLADLNGAGIDLDGSQFDAVMAGEFNSRLAKRELSAYQLAVKEAREARKASDAGRIAKAESRLKLLDERLQSRLDKALSKTKQGRDLLDAEKKVRVREIELDKIVNDARARREWDAMPKGFQALTSVMGLSRGLVLGADAGSILNQGAFALLTRPMSALKAARSGLGAIKSEKALIDVLGSVRANPNFDRAVTAGLDVKAALGNFENEFYNSDLLNKAPGYAQGSRFYDGQMTALRMNLFNSYVKSLKRMKSGKYTGGKNAGTLTDEDYKLIAEMVNTTTGVGTGSIAQGLKAANKKINLLLAPGYRISRIKTAVGFPFFEAVKKGNYRVASIILGDYLRFFGGLGAAAAGLKAAGQDVELDPRSADFMKVRKGNTSISLGAGVEAPIKAIAQTFGGAIPSRAEGEKQGKANSGMARASTFNEWFVRSVSPFYSNAQILGSQVVRRANAEPGEELKFKNFGKNVDALTPEGQENLIKMQLPLWSQQAWDLVKDSDVSTEQKYWLMVGSIFGLPVNVKERKP